MTRGDAPPASASSRLTGGLLTGLVHVALLVGLVNPYTDYDWGWHLRYGEYLLTHGRLLRADVYSWSMEGYHWVNHSWLFDPILYLLFERFSFIGLSVAGALVAGLAFVVAVRPFRLAPWQQGVLALWFYLLTDNTMHQGLRTQVVGLLLFALLIGLLATVRAGRRWPVWALPPLFLAWANLHGSVVLGLGVLGLFLVDAWLRARLARRPAAARDLSPLALSLLASAAVTLVNPFTYRIYLEAFRHFGNRLLPLVLEWTPAPTDSRLWVSFLVYTLVLGLGLAWRRRLEDVVFVVVSLLLLVMSISARRYIGIYVLATLPLAAGVLQDLAARRATVRARRAGSPVPWPLRVPLSTALVVLGAAAALYGGVSRLRPLDLFLRFSYEDYCLVGSRCSEALTRILLARPPVGRGFNYYDWGGYLIGRGVATRLFVDGRMHLWARDGYSAFAEYWQMYYIPDLARFAAAGFDWAIVPTTSAIATALGTPTPQLGRWDRVYSDRHATYFVRVR